MSTSTPFTDPSDITGTKLAGSVARPTPYAATENTSLQLRMNFANPRMAVMNVAGELDMATTPRMAELLWPRLLSEIPAIVIDLSGLTFLGVAGLELLARARTYASHRGISLSIVSGNRGVDRALAASGLNASLPSFPNLHTARSNASAALNNQHTVAPAA